MVLAGATALLLTQGVAAQSADDVVYIQIEAQPSLTSAERRLRDYTGTVGDVNGFALRGGWYGIALGPYSPLEAAETLRDLRRQGLVPRDAYLAAASEYGRQFWPVGAQQSAPETAAPAAPAPTPDAPVIAAPAEEPAAPAVIDESPREARESEGLLNAEERKQLQIALEWAGFYNSAIDGAFGRGTRNAMAEWQRSAGYEVTGVLTTRQRADLLGRYNAILEGMDMTLVSDMRAGIDIELPLGAVTFDRYEAPFAIFGPKGDSGARALLISQPGQRETLWGLYEIMQTLEIVPLKGERSRDRDSFVLTGANARIVSHTEARLSNGRIKGFTLVWPAGDEERRTRILNLMKASFRTTDGVLDPAQVSDSGQAVDLVSGLQIRKPRESVAGFFVDRSGMVLTSAAALEGCGRITLEGVYEASLVAQDAALGVAVLRPQSPLAPRGIAAFLSDTPRLKSEVAVAGYPFGGVLPSPTLTYGSIEDLKGLAGEEQFKRLALASAPGDAGGPVLDAGGAVLGMLLPREQPGGRTLPDEVAFAADSERILAFLRGAGVQGSQTPGESALAPEDLTATATGMTVKVSCWD